MVSASSPKVRSPLRNATAVGVFLLDSLLRAISIGTPGWTQSKNVPDIKHRPEQTTETEHLPKQWPLSSIPSRRPRSSPTDRARWRSADTGPAGRTARRRASIGGCPSRGNAKTDWDDRYRSVLDRRPRVKTDRALGDRPFGRTDATYLRGRFSDPHRTNDAQRYCYGRRAFEIYGLRDDDITDVDEYTGSWWKASCLIHRDDTIINNQRSVSKRDVLR